MNVYELAAKLPPGARACKVYDPFTQVAIPIISSDGHCPLCVTSHDPPAWGLHVDGVIVGAVNARCRCGQLGPGWRMSAVLPLERADELIEWAHETAREIRDERISAARELLADAAEQLRSAGWDPSDLTREQAQVILKGDGPLSSFPVYDEGTLPAATEWLSVDQSGGPLVVVVYRGDTRLPVILGVPSREDT